MQGQLTTLESIQRYALAGKAILTLVSKKTGTRFTYRITSVHSDREDRAVFYANVLTGSNNTDPDCYTPVAVIAHENDAYFYYPSRLPHAVGDAAPSARALRWAVAKLLVTPDVTALEQLEVFHEGFCARCGRLLTNPESVTSGLGPVCTAM